MGHSNQNAQTPTYANPAVNHQVYPIPFLHHIHTPPLLHATPKLLHAFNLRQSRVALFRGLICCFVHQDTWSSHYLEILIAQLANFPNPRLDSCLVLALNVHDARTATGAEEHKALVYVGRTLERSHLLAGRDMMRAD